MTGQRLVYGDYCILGRNPCTSTKQVLGVFWVVVKELNFSYHIIDV